MTEKIISVDQMNDGVIVTFAGGGIYSSMLTSCMSRWTSALTIQEILYPISKPVQMQDAEWHIACCGTAVATFIIAFQLFRLPARSFSFFS